MQSTIEILNQSNDTIEAIQNCLTLLSEVHPSLEKFAKQLRQTLNEHMEELEMIRELCRGKDIDLNNESILAVMNEALVDAISALSKVLELTKRLLNATAELNK